MSAKAYFQSVRRCLFARGVMGEPANRLVEEIEDHFFSALDDARKSGHDADAAERLALEALGAPDFVARSAAENLKGTSWMARHPWLFSVGIGFSALVANQFFLVGVIAVIGLHIDFGPWSQAKGQVLATVMNWTILVAGGACLLALARRYAMGWKTLFLAGLSMAMFLSLVGVWRVSNYASDDLRLILECSPIGALLMKADGGYYDLRMFVDLTSSSAQIFLLHFLAPVLVLIGVRFGTPRVMAVRAA